MKSITRTALTMILASSISRGESTKSKELDPKMESAIWRAQAQVNTLRYPWETANQELKDAIDKASKFCEKFKMKLKEENKSLVCAYASEVPAASPAQAPATPPAK